MIKKVEEIYKLGIFDNYQWECSNEFNKYNIFFGFNGSGKSTLSSLFNLITTKKIFSQEEKQELYEDLKTSDNAFVKFNNTLTYPPNGNSNYKNIYVFNSNFIANHVYDGTIGKMSKFNVEETFLEDPIIKNLNLEIDFLQLKKKEKKDEINEIINKFNNAKKTYNTIFRTHFPNKQLKVGNKIPKISEIPQKTKSEIEKELEQKTAEYQLSKKQVELEEDITKISNLTFKKIDIDLSKIFNLLRKSAKENATNSLKKRIELYQNEINEEKSDKIEPWFELGEELLKISKNKNKNLCPVCKTDLTNSIDSLIAEFADYFDKSYTEFIDELKSLKQTIDFSIIDLEENTKNKDLLKNYAFKYSNFLKINFPELKKTDIKIKLLDVEQKINSKIGNTSKKIFIDVELINKSITNYNTNIEKLIRIRNNTLKTLKNQKIDPIKIEKEIRELYTQLVYLELNGNEKEKRIEKFHTLFSEILVLNSKISVLTDEKIKRLKELKLEAKKVGEYLEKLGITHFTIDLREDEEENNILIKYKGIDRTKNKLRNTLSAGEKTSLALAYFFSKVSTEVTNKTQTIIVIDDPISSLDDNRLYDTAFLIHEEFKDYKQLFVLSHNMIFLKYLNPFFRKQKETFLINKGKIEDLPTTLQNFQSPYFYMLETVIKFNLEDEPDYEDARKFLPNYIRRILETFFSFKYAQLSRKGNKNQSPGLDDFINGIIDFDSLPEYPVGEISKANIKNRLSNLNKICDSHSHGNMQQLDECNFIPNETLKKIASDTINIIKFFDNVHKKSVEKIINSAE